MSENQLNQLARLLGDGRHRAQLSIRDLAERSGVPKSTVQRLEFGDVASPHPATLEALAEALGLDSTDLYAAAGYTKPQGLPSFTPYLRRKYSDLPEAAMQELESSFERIAQKYGYDGHGPSAGEDER